MFEACQNEVKINLILALLNHSKCATLKKKVEKLKVKSFSVLIFLGQKSAIPDISLYVLNKDKVTVSNNFGIFKVILAIFGSSFKSI